MRRYVLEKPTLKRYKVYPSLEQICREEGYANAFTFWRPCVSQLGASPRALWRACHERGDLTPIGLEEEL